MKLKLAAFGSELINIPEHRQDEASCPRRLAREYYAEMMEMRRRALAAEEECWEAEREISELMAAKEREEAEARRHWARAKRLMSDVFDLRKVLKGGASLKKQEHFARLKLDEKVKRLREMGTE